MIMSLRKFTDIFPKDEFIQKRKYYNGENFDLATQKGVFSYK